MIKPNLRNCINSNWTIWGCFHKGISLKKKINLSWLKGYQIMDFWIIDNKPICGNVAFVFKISRHKVGRPAKRDHGQNGSKPFWLISQCITILGLLDVKRGETLRRKYRIICRHYWENRINYVWSRE